MTPTQNYTDVKVAIRRVIGADLRSAQPFGELVPSSDVFKNMQASDQQREHLLTMAHQTPPTAAVPAHALPVALLSIMFLHFLHVMICSYMLFHGVACPRILFYVRIVRHAVLCA